jgi:hypothetical protein
MAESKVEVGRWDERDPGRAARGAGPGLQALEALAWVLDSSIPVPGTRFRIGLDGLLGLVPVVGDLLGTLLSAYILVQAARMGVPRVTLLRMGFNVTLEAVVGMVPVAGDLFDFAWKANQRNVELLRAHARDPGRARRGDWAFASLFILFVLAAAGLLGWGTFALGRALLGLFGG